MQNSTMSDLSMFKNGVFLAVIGFCALGNAQKNTIQDSTLLSLEHHIIQNDSTLAPVKALLNETAQPDRVVNIVHIGDSHVQGAVFPDAIRTALQKTYGNAGRGFIFPYRVAGTNGDSQVRFSSANAWRNVRNVKSDGRDNIGLSGILLETTDADFVLKLSLDGSLVNQEYLHVLSPSAQSLLISKTLPARALQTAAAKNTYKNVYYKVKRGDNLSTIAQKHKTTTTEIKALNNMRKTLIRAGQTLIVKQQVIPGITIPEKNIEKQKPESLAKNSAGDYILDPDSKQLYISAALDDERYLLDGFVLKNNNAGIRYHAIGVNGAQFKDYTLFPRFFEQLTTLQPDLIIVSLGTNESFSQDLTTETFYAMLQDFNAQLQKQDILAPVLATSPPPSFKNRKIANESATSLSLIFKEKAADLGWAFYDLHNVMGSSKNMPLLNNNNLTSSDLVHYNVEGYTLMGALIADILIKTMIN